MTIAKTMNAERPEARRRRTVLTPEQRKAWDAYYEPRNAAFPHGRTSRARTWCAGSTTATCTTTWAASRPSTRASAGCSKYLDDEGLAENTIVVYSSDQGFYLGEHGWFDKRWIFEESLRTPLLVRWPGVVKPGSVNHDLVSNLDFAETFLEAAGLPVPGEMQGRSLVPLLTGQTPRRLANELLLSVLRVSPAASRPAALRRGDRSRYKLVHFDGPDVECLGALRPGEGPARAAERVRRPGLCGGRGRSEAGARPAAVRAQGARRAARGGVRTASPAARATIRAVSGPEAGPRSGDARHVTNHCEILVYLRVCRCFEAAESHKLDPGAIER